MKDWVVRGVDAVSSVHVSYSSQDKAYEHSDQPGALTWIFRWAMTLQIPSAHGATEGDTAGKTIFKRLVSSLLQEIHTEDLIANAQPCLLIRQAYLSPGKLCCLAEAALLDVRRCGI